MDKKTLEILDQCALNFYVTRDVKYFNEFCKYARPTIEIYVSHTCLGSVKWDAEELFSILFADMWRLFKVYIPVKDKKFHWLMFRQLKNKTRNYILNNTGRNYSYCFVCNTKQSGSAKIMFKVKEMIRGVQNMNMDIQVNYIICILHVLTHSTNVSLTPEERHFIKCSNKVCCKCGELMQKPRDITGVEQYDLTYGHNPDYLQHLGNKELVDIILNVTKRDNPKTHKILTMLLEGYSKSDISAEVKIAQNAINNRITKCKDILSQLNANEDKKTFKIRG